jgi:hypothetical protein
MLLSHGGPSRTLTSHPSPPPAPLAPGNRLKNERIGVSTLFLTALHALKPGRQPTSPDQAPHRPPQFRAAPCASMPGRHASLWPLRGTSPLRLPAVRATRPGPRRFWEVVSCEHSKVPRELHVVCSDGPGAESSRAIPTQRRQSAQRSYCAASSIGKWSGRGKEGGRGGGAVGGGVGGSGVF